MDPRWNTFAAVCRRDFGACTFASELVRECGGNEDIAWATYFHLRDDALAWLQRSVPALDGSVPKALIEAGHPDTVRDCLWSMPC